MSNFVLVVDGVVAQADCTGNPPEGFIAAGAEVVPGFLFDGEGFHAPDIAPSVDDYSSAIARHLDATARLRQYDGILSAMTYRGDANPVFAAEAEALFAWRSAVWTYALAELAKVENDERGVPSVADLIAELPSMEWPA